jgi:hypothetical protein
VELEFQGIYSDSLGRLAPGELEQMAQKAAVVLLDSFREASAAPPEEGKGRIDPGSWTEVLLGGRTWRTLSACLGGATLRIWTLAAENQVLVAHCRLPAALAPAGGAAAEGVLARLRPTRYAPRWADFMSPQQYEDFLDTVLAWVSQRDLKLELVGSTLCHALDAGCCDLEPLARSLCRLPRARWAEAVSRYLDRHAGGRFRLRLPGDLRRKLGSFATVQGLLTLRLYPGDIEGRELLACREDLEGTVTALVLDLPTGLLPLTLQDVKVWGRPLEDLFETARYNVAARVRPERHQRRPARGIELLLLRGSQPLVASHVLLLKELHRQGLGPRGSLVAVPNRHTVVLCPLEDQDPARAARHVLAAIEEFGRNGAITDSLYWFDAERFHRIPYQQTPEGPRLVLPPSLARAVGA